MTRLFGQYWIMKYKKRVRIIFYAAFASDGSVEMSQIISYPVRTNILIKRFFFVRLLFEISRHPAPPC